MSARIFTFRVPIIFLTIMQPPLNFGRYVKYWIGFWGIFVECGRTEPLSVISRNSTSIWPICVEFLDSVYRHLEIFSFSAAIDIQNEKNDMSKLYTIPGRMLLIRRKNSNGKYQNDAITSSNLEKKLAQKAHILTLYRISYSEDLGIPDLRSISIGFHTVKMCDFRSTFLGRFEEVIASFWYFPF